MANNLFWKCGDGEWNTSTGIGRTVLAIVTDYIDYIKQDLDKDFDALSSELFLSGGNTQKLIDDLEKVTIKNRKHFYCKEGEIIHFRDKKIVVNNEFGRTGQSKERWENFIKLISGLGSGYVIGDGGFTDKVKSEHVIKAFNHIGEKDNKDKNGIQYVFNPSLYMGVSSKGHNNWFAINEAMRVAYLYATGEQPSEEDGNFTEEQIMRDSDMFGNSRWVEKRFKELGFEVKRFKKGEEPMPKDENKIVEETLKVLKQFKQIILFGPPGTGKTFGAKKLLKELFRVETDEKFKAMQKDIPSGETLVEKGLTMYERNRWDIVQFHPSYNYEDFVRGINVFTENHMVKYIAQDRIFVDMCGQAQRDPDREYALIIDEINRANVSAVLGELIYALEYRGAKIQIPYSGTLTIPENLYIIGTMNTADRTIGQIDYAVRRRFAFVHCPPKESVIKEQIDKGEASDKSVEFFNKVNRIFDECTSQDFDEKDIRIGHSYFLASGYKLANKIIYQVVPILHEYVKDGVLTSGAKELINEIEESAKKVLADESGETDLSANKEDKQQQIYEGNFIFFWKTTEATGFNLMGVTALNIIKHYVKHYKPKNLNALLEELSLPSNAVVSEPEVINANAYFPQVENKLFLADGSRNIVSFVWPNKPTNAKWKNFVDKAKGVDYEISICHFVNIGQDPRRNWQDCAKYGFIAAGGDEGGRHAKAMEKLKEGSPVFAYLGGSGVSSNKKGFVAWGWVINEAVPIREFKVEDGKLLSECESVYSENNGRNYKEQYSESFDSELCDYAVGIKWIKVLSEEDTVKLTWNANIVRERINGFHKLQKAFNLSGNETEMTSQSSSGKDKELFRWKHKDSDEYSLPLGVGQTAREVITDFIHKHRNKNIGDFQKEFESIKYGKYLRVVSLEEGEKVNKDNGYKLYFTEPEHHVLLKNGKIVVISNRWGATRSYEAQWKEFKDKMAELDYSIDEEAGR